VLGIQIWIFVSCIWNSDQIQIQPVNIFSFFKHFLYTSYSGIIQKKTVPYLNAKARQASIGRLLLGVSCALSYCWTTTRLLLLHAYTTLFFLLLILLFESFTSRPMQKENNSHQ
jgi:hypothetical protein